MTPFSAPGCAAIMLCVLPRLLAGNRSVERAGRGAMSTGWPVGCPAHLLQGSTADIFQSRALSSEFPTCGPDHAAAVAGGAALQRPVLGDGSALVGALRPHLQGHPIGAEANGSFAKLRPFSAWDALALRETWTDKDTEFLRRLDPRPGAFVDGDLSTASFTSQLPSRAALEALVQKGGVAIVGSGPTLKGQGQEIDAHSTVVRFNDNVGQNLDAANTGLRTDIHVMNSQVGPPPEPDTVQFDLECVAPWESFCARMNLKGRFRDTQHQGKMFLMRPTVICSIPRIHDFTRGFLFYWLMGSFFEKVDFYGMSDADGRGHCSGKGCPRKAVQEPFLEFEHLLYRKAKELV